MGQFLSIQRKVIGKWRWFKINWASSVNTSQSIKTVQLDTWINWEQYKMWIQSVWMSIWRRKMCKFHFQTSPVMKKSYQIFYFDLRSNSSPTFMQTVDEFEATMSVCIMSNLSIVWTIKLLYNCRSTGMPEFAYSIAKRTIPKSIFSQIIPLRSRMSKSSKHPWLILSKHFW